MDEYITGGREEHMERMKKDGGMCRLWMEMGGEGEREEGLMDRWR